VSPPAELVVDAEPPLMGNGDPPFGSVPLDPDTVWHPVGVVVAVMPADAALTSSQKARIQEKVKTAALAYLDSLGNGYPVYVW
ncbi:hypothetical protein CVH13_00627, partial [Dehalococcoides mccartyi]